MGIRQFFSLLIGSTLSSGEYLSDWASKVVQNVGKNMTESAKLYAEKNGETAWESPHNQSLFERICHIFVSFHVITSLVDGHPKHLW